MAAEKIAKKLEKLRGTETIIVGIGNVLKGDDGAGPAVCQQLKGQISAEIIDAGSVPENYIQTIIKKAPQNLLIVDAADFKASVGTIRIFKVEQLNAVTISTHTLSPHLFVDMIRRQIKVGVYFLGIQPAQTQFGQPLSVEVREAVQKLCSVLAEIFPHKKQDEDISGTL